MLDATPLLRMYAGRRRRVLERIDPVAEQERQLRALVAAGARTRFGRDHDFGRVSTVADYQARVPLRTYEEFWRTYWQPDFPRVVDATWPGKIRYFTLSSGTTSGTSKYIPLTPAMEKANRRAALDTLVHHLTHRPDSRIFGGRTLMLGGSSALDRLADGVYSGDLSGIVAKRMPLWARPMAFPPPEIALIGDWEEKIRRMAALAPDRNIRAISGTPSWMLMLFEALARGHPHRGHRLADLFPDLELIIHGAVHFGPYRQRFADLLAGSRAELREVYPASEGFVAVADRGAGEGLRLMLDTGLFYEFVPLEELGSDRPTRHWIADAETGVNYALAVTCNAGLWSYVLGDTVRLVDRSPPRLLITGRTAYMLSVFGEHLIAEEIETAVTAGCGTAGLAITDYSVGAITPNAGAAPDTGADGTVGGHLFLCEFAEAAVPPAAETAFLGAVDAELNRLNDDYRAHRTGLRPPALWALAPGTFARWMKARGRLGGQNKVPRIISDPAVFADLMAFVNDSRVNK